MIQWNPSITDTFRKQCFGLYTEVAFIQRWPLYRGGLYTEVRGYFVHKLFIWDLGAGHYSEVVVNRGSTVLTASVTVTVPDSIFLNLCL